MVRKGKGKGGFARLRRAAALDHLRSPLSIPSHSLPLPTRPLSARRRSSITAHQES